MEESGMCTALVEGHEEIGVLCEMCLLRGFCAE